MGNKAAFSSFFGLYELLNKEDATLKIYEKSVKNDFGCLSGLAPLTNYT